MIMDNETLFANNWAPTATGDNISTNVLDLGPMGGIGTGGTNTSRDIGQGEGITLEILVQQAVTSAGAATVDFRLVTDTVAAISTPVTLVSSGAVAKATLVAGYTYRVRLPSSASYKRYIGVNANIGTAVLTAGQFQCKLVKDIQGNTKYASGFGLDV